MSAFEQAVEASCPACDRERAQTRVFDGAKVQHLRCETCGAIHAYSVDDPATAPAPQAGVRVLDLAALTELHGSDNARPYRADTSFGQGELIDHPSFGRGYVMTVLSPGNKMQVLFDDKRRILVCRLDSGARAQEAAAKSPAAVTPPRKASSRRRSRRRPRSEPAPVASEAPTQNQGPVACPRCGRSVHPYNVLLTPSGEPAGCMYCRG